MASGERARAARVHRCRFCRAHPSRGAGVSCRREEEGYPLASRWPERLWIVRPGGSTGNVAALETVLLQEFRESPEVYRRLLVERNQAWAPKIAACAAEPKPCLVVVGGAHLVGPDSVVALLRSAGFTVDQQ